MPLNTSEKEMIERRREVVSHLRLQGRTQREIAVALAEQGIVNPETGGAFCAATVCLDLRALKSEWKRNAAAATEDHTARLLAELQEVKRAAWTTGELRRVIESIAQECKILDLDAPEKQQHSGEVRIVVHYDNADPDDAAPSSLPVDGDG